MTTHERRFGGFDAAAQVVRVGPDAVTLWQVHDLERHVDRAALLRGDADAPEPPYWAYVWSGARLLAEHIPRGAGRALELGCGLGLPGLVAARRGWRATMLDRLDAPLHFVRASAASSVVDLAGCVVADATAPVFRQRFDLVLAAEVLYDRSAFPAMARAFADHLAPDGVLLMADGRRIDTRAFYAELDAVGLTWRALDLTVREEGLPIAMRLVEMRHRHGGQTSPYFRIFR